VRRLLALITMLLAFAAFGCGDDDESGDDGGTTTTETQTTVETTPSEPGECTEVAQPEPKRDGGEDKPTEPLSGQHEVTFQTNCGSFTVAMDEEVGGLSAASFVELARSGFYEDTFFHRIAPGFVIQGGDPTGTGTGGPGYTTEDAPPSDASYGPGVVAMAKAGPEPPGTAGSQFFVTLADAGLPPDYAIVGEVSEGLDVVEAIGQLGDATEQPTQVVKIEKATVRER
jgi:cyclophilin family peptidyl-prolyl cis-trans isomerase